jgi:hypothetical protein
LIQSSGIVVLKAEIVLCTLRHVVWLMIVKRGLQSSFGHIAVACVFGARELVMEACQSADMSIYPSNRDCAESTRSSWCLWKTPFNDSHVDPSFSVQFKSGGLTLGKVSGRRRLDIAGMRKHYAQCISPYTACALKPINKLAAPILISTSSKASDPIQPTTTEGYNAESAPYRVG